MVPGWNFYQKTHEAARSMHVLNHLIPWYHGSTNEWIRDDHLSCKLNEACWPGFLSNEY